MCELCGDQQHSLFGGGSLSAWTPGGTGSGPLQADKTEWSADEIARYLSHGYWEDTGRAAHSFDMAPGAVITVNLNALDSTGKDTARAALQSWSAVTGLEFNETSNAQITFDDRYSGAYASYTATGSRTETVFINIHSSWASNSDYYLQTYIHEIGHALGLGHGGNYNGSGDFDEDALYANDSWQMSVMSYFNQLRNPYVDASFTYLLTPQLADILAVHTLYGRPDNLRTGATTYGDGNSTGFDFYDLADLEAVVLVDSGGADTIDLSTRIYDQRLDLNQEAFSDLNGGEGNFAIARGTVIENATTGHGEDELIGNASDNLLISGADEDTITGGAGRDTLVGGAGGDWLTGGEDEDVFLFTALGDAGDRITDFSVEAGDLIDLDQVLTAHGHSAETALSAGLFSLDFNSWGAWLSLALGGVTTQVAFLYDLANDTYVGSLLLGADAPPPGPNNRYTFTDSQVTAWDGAVFILDDTDGGTDTLDLQNISFHSVVSLENGTTSSIGAASFSLTETADIENLILGSGNDFATGTEGQNVISGNAGNDSLNGFSGQDTIDGGAGDDLIRGGHGDDVLISGTGNDTLIGNQGDDLIVIGLTVPADDLAVDLSLRAASSADREPLAENLGYCEFRFGDGDPPIKAREHDDPGDWML